MKHGKTFNVTAIVLYSYYYANQLISEEEIVKPLTMIYHTVFKMYYDKSNIQHFYDNHIVRVLNFFF